MKLIFFIISMCTLHLITQSLNIKRFELNTVLSSLLMSNWEFVTFPLASWVRRGT